MGVIITPMAAAQFGAYLANAPTYGSLALAVEEAGLEVIEGGLLAGRITVFSGGAATATSSATATALELAEASNLAASATEMSSAAVSLAASSSGSGYTLVGLTSMEMGAVAAAAAPLLGVALGATLYQSNPALWNKLSQKLLPFCYPGTTEIPMWIDIVKETGVFKLLVALGLIDALDEFFQEEGIGGDPGKGEATYTKYQGVTLQYAGACDYASPNAGRRVVTEGITDGFFYTTSLNVVVGISRVSQTVRYTYYGSQRTANITNRFLANDGNYYYKGSVGITYAEGTPSKNTFADDGQAADIYYNGNRWEGNYPEGTSQWTGDAPPEVLPWVQPIIVVPEPLGPDYQPIEEPVTPISPQILPELPPHEDPIPLPPHVDPDPETPVEPIQPTEPDYPPDEWPEEEPWPPVIPFPWPDPDPDPEHEWPEVMPWPLPEVPPSEWPTAPVWPTEVPIPQPWPYSPEDWPDEFDWPETPPEWWPIYPWPNTPERWPDEIPWPDEPPESWPDEIPWPLGPDGWPTEIPWPETKPDDWPDTIPWPNSPDDWPDTVPWPVPWPPEWPEGEPWPVRWPDGVPYPHRYPTPVPSPDPDRYPDPLPDPTGPDIDPRIDPSPFPDPRPNPYDPEPDPPSPVDDPSSPDPIPQTPEPYDPTPPPPEGDSPPYAPSPIIPLPFSSSTGLITVYNPTQAELLNFANWLWVTWEDATIEKVWNNPFDGVISLFELYCTPTVEGSKAIRSGFLTSPVVSNYISRYTTINCGSIGIPEYYGNYLDYAPYTKAFIYLPFIGVVELNSDDIVGHAVNVTYHIDEYNGSCIAQITVAKTIEINGSSVDYSNTFYQFSGNCAVELPISGGSQAAIKAGMLEAAAWGLGSVIGGVLGGSSLGQIGQGLAYGAASAVHSVVSAKSSVQHSGSFGSSYGAMGIKTPYITVVRPKQIQVPNYEVMYGFPAHKGVIIGQCSGFLRCREVHIHSSTASDEEKALIEQTLKEGVIIGDAT